MKGHAITLGKELIDNKKINAAIGVMFFVLAISLSAYIRIPIAGSPVPITMQTLFVMLCGATIGKRLGPLSQTAYIAMGAAGVPIFQGLSSGFLYILGPTGGYLAGFVLAAYLIGMLTRSIRLSVIRIAGIFLLGDIIIHVLGASWLAYLFGMSAKQSFVIGILPFIPGELLKISVATLIYSKIYRRAQNIF